MLPQNHVLQNRYRIIRPLGRGGMGHVYEAMDEAVDCIVAIKETFADTDKMRRAFEREAKLLANLRHPALPRVTHHFFEGDKQFLVMDFIEGEDLYELLKNRKSPFAYDEVMNWADKLLDALNYLHSRPQPIIHRDIKPANIKLSPDGQLFLLDFGLAKGTAGQMSEGDESQSSVVSIYGFTIAYAPLEQLNNSGTSAQSDLYSLGATLYHLLSRRIPPTAAERYEQIDQDRPDPLLPIHRLNPNVPHFVSNVLTQAMAMSRRERIASATVMRQALKEAHFNSEATRDSSLPETVLSPTPSQLAVDEHSPIPGLTAPAPTVKSPLLAGSNLSAEKNYRAVQVEDHPAGATPIIPPDNTPIISAEPSWPSQIASEAKDSQAALPDAVETRRQEEEAERLRLEAEAQRKKEDDERRRREVEEAAARQRAAELAAQAQRREREEELQRELELRAPRREAPPQPNNQRKWIIGSSITLLVVGIVLFIAFSSHKTTQPDNQTSTTDEQRPGKTTVAPPPVFKFARDLPEQHGTAWAVAFSPDGRLAASASEGGGVQFWDASSWDLIAAVPGHKSAANSIAFSPDSQTIASASNDKSILLYPVISDATTKLIGHTDEVYFVAFSPDGKTLASASKDKTVKVWDVQSGKEIKTLQGHNDVVWSVAFSPDGKILASASKDKTIKLWDTQTWQLIKTLSGHTSAVISLAFSPDGKTLASGSDDNTIKLWDTQTWQELRTLTGHSKYITSLAFSHDGQTLASASNDQTIRLWNAQTGELRQTLTGHSKSVTSLSFSPDGKTLVSGSKDGTVKVWQ